MSNLNVWRAIFCYICFGRLVIVIESGDYMTNPSDKVVSVAFAELQELLKDYPVEHVEFDEHGRYDVDKYPEFHDWVING